MAPKQLISVRAIQPFYGSEPEPGCLDTLKAKLHACQQYIDCWPTRSVTDGFQTINTFSSHQDWYAEVRDRVSKKSWRPSDLRVVCNDPVVAARTAAWLRKAKLQKRSGDWVVGEYVRLLDPVFDVAGNLLQEPDQEYKITLVRPISYGDSRGVVHWRTEKRQDPRELDITIPAMDLRAVRLQPLKGDEPPVAVLTEQPGLNEWRNTCRRFRETLAGARHDAETYEQGLQWSGELQRQVVRLRSAAVLPAEKFDLHRSTAIALHADMRGYGKQACELAAHVVACAERELLLYQESFRERL